MNRTGGAGNGSEDGGEPPTRREDHVPLVFAVISHRHRPPEQTDKSNSHLSADSIDKDLEGAVAAALGALERALQRALLKDLKGARKQWERVLENYRMLKKDAVEQAIWASFKEQQRAARTRTGLGGTKGGRSRIPSALLGKDDINRVRAEWTEEDLRRAISATFEAYKEETGLQQKLRRSLRDYKMETTRRRGALARRWEGPVRKKEKIFLQQAMSASLEAYKEKEVRREDEPAIPPSRPGLDDPVGNINWDVKHAAAGSIDKRWSDKRRRDKRKGRAPDPGLPKLYPYQEHRKNAEAGTSIEMQRARDHKVMSPSQCTASKQTAQRQGRKPPSSFGYRYRMPSHGSSIH
jgi:hypothetical protein